MPCVRSRIGSSVVWNWKSRLGCSVACELLRNAPIAGCFEKRNASHFHPTRTSLTDLTFPPFLLFNRFTEQDGLKSFTAESIGFFLEKSPYFTQIKLRGIGWNTLTQAWLARNDRSNAHWNQAIWYIFQVGQFSGFLCTSTLCGSVSFLQLFFLSQYVELTAFVFLRVLCTL
jgi:hypothetical protein